MKELPMMITASKVKAFIAEQECRSAGDFAAKLNEEVAELITKAVKRCKDNGRATVKPSDL